MKLVLYQGRLNTGNMSMFRRLREEATKACGRYDKLVASINSVCDRYAQAYPDLIDRIKSLKLEIRLLTKGTPVTEPLEPEDVDLDDRPEASQQQSAAYLQMVKIAYRRLARITHPDRGGDPATFILVIEAYKRQDLSALNSLYLVISKCQDLWWQSSEEGLYWAATELERPRARLSVLQTKPAYQVAAQHSVGSIFQASKLMERLLQEQIQTLNNELHYLRTKNVKSETFQNET